MHTHTLTHLMPTVLKSFVPQATVRAGQEQVSTIVRDIISDVRNRGDAAVREYSAKFDNWSPETFLLDAAAIERIMSGVPSQVIADIETVQANVRRFAQAQRASMTDFEIETAPGRAPRSAAPADHRDRRLRAQAAATR